MTTGFIFDLDGVLTDTAEFHYRSWRQLADEENLPFSREDNEALRGVPRRRSLEILLKGRVIPEAQMLDYMARKNAYYRALLDEIDGTYLLTGVREFLLEAKQRGIKLGLGSASRNAHEVCMRLGIRDLFDAFGDGGSVEKAKPAPDLFLWVARAMGVDVRDCLIFEDAEAGIEAANRGGFLSVGIGPVERVGMATVCVERLADIGVEEALALLGRRE